MKFNYLILLAIVCISAVVSGKYSYSSRNNALPIPKMKDLVGPADPKIKETKESKIKQCVKFFAFIIRKILEED